VLASGNGCPPDSLHEYLCHRPPNYMIPTAVVMLDALQVRPHGKLDHAALPAPKADSDRHGRAPRTLQGKLLCELLARTLGLVEVSIGNDFPS
jgi:nonribosomal peptide synthetase DhbF